MTRSSGRHDHLQQRRGLVLLTVCALAFGLAGLPGQASAAVAGAPTVSDSSESVDAGTTGTFYLYSEDDDPDTATFQVTSGPSHGSLGTLADPDCAGGACSTSVDYTPAPGATTDSFTY